MSELSATSLPVKVLVSADHRATMKPTEQSPKVAKHGLVNKKKVGASRIKKFILNSASDFHIKVKDISLPQFTSSHSSIDNKQIKFPATYNIFMKKFVCLVSIISVFPVPQDQLNQETSEEDDCTDFWIDCSKVLEASRMIAVYRKAKDSDRKPSDMIEAERVQYKSGESKYQQVAGNIPTICGNLHGAGTHYSVILKEISKSYLSHELDVNWVHKFLKQSQKMRETGVFTDSHNYSSTYLWEQFAHLLDYVVFEYNE